MGKLVDVLQDPQVRRAMAEDGARLVDAEVARKGGMSGLALKGAFAVVQRVRPGYVGDALERLLPSFATRLDPFYEARQQEAPDQPMERYLSNRAQQVADALLAITDERAARAEKGPLRTTYEKLRPVAARHVEEAVPGIGRLLDSHVR